MTRKTIALQVMDAETIVPEKISANSSRPFVISFSGIDGAGKTTQIENVTCFLQERGLRVARFTFWDDVAVWSNMRSEVGQRSANASHAGQQGKVTFSTKNNKHIRKWYLSLARAGMYLLDAASLRRLLARQTAQNADVIIFDRYIYDQVANLYSQSRAARLYVRILLKQAPAPDLPLILDASPEAAFVRKPEYPLDFVRRNRQTFLNLRELVPQMVVISQGTPEDVKSEIYGHLRRSQLIPRYSPEMTSEGKAEAASPETVATSQTSCSV